MLSFLISLPKLPKRPNAGDDMSFKVSSQWVVCGAGDVEAATTRREGAGKLG
jgi:hypothetical protein